MLISFSFDVFVDLFVDLSVDLFMDAQQRS